MSDKNLGQLITSLKTEAIESAEKESAKIIEAARLQARQIVQKAEEQKETLISEAEQEAQTILDKGKSALRQAGRDYSISVRNELLNIFQAVLVEETSKEFSSDLLKSAILKIVENIDGDVELEFSQDFSKELAGYIHDRVKSSEKTITIIENNSLLGGFSISNKKQGWSYTVSPEEVAEGLSGHLNSNWINILKQEIPT